MRRKPRPQSFTLVETMVSIAILSILVLLLLSMLGTLTNTWQLGQAHNERRNVAQAVLDRMARDLRYAAIPSSRTDTNGLGFVINPTGVSMTNCAAMFWQAPVATDGGTQGNLAVVGYFVQWVHDTSSPSFGTPCLCRLVINPSDTNYIVYTAGGTNWINDAMLQADAAATETSGYQGLLAENVIGIWAQALDPQGNPIVQNNNNVGGQIFDSHFPYAFSNFATAQGQLTTNLASSLPSSVRIAVAVIDSRTAAHLAAKPTYYGPTANFWGDVQNFYTNLPTVIRKGTEIQVSTIPLACGPR